LRDLTPAGAAGVLAISAPVGLGGSNLPADVKSIQDALNQVPADQGGPGSKLVVNGVADVLPKRRLRRFKNGSSGGRIPASTWPM
jgi:hypothetical protein